MKLNRKECMEAETRDLIEKALDAAELVEFFRLLGKNNGHQSGGMESHGHHPTVKLEDMTHVQVHDDVNHTNGLSHSDSNHANSINMGSHHVGSLSDISEPSSPESATFDDADLLAGAGVSDDMNDVAARLATAGPVGLAAAAAIITGKKRKKNFTFETNPSIRKRQSTRLLRKLKQLLTEYTTRVGQQACIVVCCPGKMGSSFKCFGAAPLETIIKNHKMLINEDLETALAQQAPPMNLGNPDAHELPPLIMEGFPTPVDKMTQAQLRAFIPIMLKYSTGRGKPGWGRENTKPPWWPDEVPWANVRSDVRSNEDKQKLSWTNALRSVVRNCYQFHGREELLDAFSTGTHNMEQQHQQQTQVFTSQYPHLVHTINNADGTVSIIQVDAAGTVTTLSETATHTEGTQAVATLAEVASTSQGDGSIYSNQIDHNMTHSHTNVNTIGETSMHESQLHEGQIHEGQIHEGQLMLGEAVSGATALVGVQDSSGGIVSIPVQAAAAMMQIQGTNLIPVSISSGGSVQFITTSSLPNFQLAHHQAQTHEHGESGAISIDVPIHQAVHDGQASEANSVPSATQAVEVVTLSDQQQQQQQH